MGSPSGLAAWDPNQRMWRVPPVEASPALDGAQLAQLVIGGGQALHTLTYYLLT